LKCVQENLTDGFLEHILHMDGIVPATDLLTRPPVSLTLAGDVAQLYVAGGDGNSWRAARKPLMAETFSWLENDLSNSNQKPSQLGGKGLLSVRIHLIT